MAEGYKVTELDRQFEAAKLDIVLFQETRGRHTETRSLVNYQRLIVAGTSEHNGVEIAIQILISKPGGPICVLCSRYEDGGSL